MRAAASKRYRRISLEAVRDEGINSGPWSKATIAARFYHKQDRRRDDVNHLAMMKSAYDGIVEAGLIMDDDSKHLTTMPAEFHVDRENPRVELTITRLRN